MISYILRKIAQFLFAFLFLLVFVFFVTHLSEIPSISLSAEDSPYLKSVRHEFSEQAFFYVSVKPKNNLNRESLSLWDIFPIMEWNSENQFHTWLWGNHKTGGILKGDLGISEISNISVNTLIRQSLPYTLLLSLVSLILVYPISILLGIFLSFTKRKKIKSLLSFVTVFLSTTPRFFLALLFIMFFSNPEILYWFPSYLGSESENKAAFWVLPILSYSLVFIGPISHQVEVSMKKELSSNYISFSVLKGLTRFRVVYIHALKNAIGPLISHFGFILPGLFAGSLTIEIIFSIPGMGEVLYNAYLQRDYPVISGIAMVLAALGLMGSFLMDIIYYLVYRKEER